MGLDDDDIAIGDYPRVCEELENALAEIEQLKAALSEARWIARTPGPATKAMIEEAKKIMDEMSELDPSFDPSNIGNPWLLVLQNFLAEWSTASLSVPDSKPT